SPRTCSDGGKLFGPPRHRARPSLGEPAMFYVRIPTERVGVLIGPGGETKSRILERTGIILQVDSASGEVTIDESGATAPALSLKSGDSVFAIGRGFPEGRGSRRLQAA